MNSKMISVSIPKEMLPEIEKALGHPYRNRSELIREALRRYLSRDLERVIPPRRRQPVNIALNEMRRDPFSGDTTALKGEYRGLFRRRVGPWRIIFEIETSQRLVMVHDILRRSSTAY